MSAQEGVAKGRPPWPAGPLPYHHPLSGASELHNLVEAPAMGQNRAARGLLVAIGLWATLASPVSHGWGQRGRQWRGRVIHSAARPSGASAVCGGVPPPASAAPPALQPQRTGTGTHLHLPLWPSHAAGMAAFLPLCPSRSAGTGCELAEELRPAGIHTG